MSPVRESSQYTVIHSYRNCCVNACVAFVLAYLQHQCIKLTVLLDTSYMMTSEDEQFFESEDDDECLEVSTIWVTCAHQGVALYYMINIMHSPVLRVKIIICINFMYRNF